MMKSKNNKSNILHKTAKMRKDEKKVCDRKPQKTLVHEHNFKILEFQRCFFLFHF